MISTVVAVLQIAMDRHKGLYNRSVVRVALHLLEQGVCSRYEGFDKGVRTGWSVADSMYFSASPR